MSSQEEPKLLYCHCAFARIIKSDIKKAVLEKLSESGRSFEAVADLCEMSAKKDPELKRLFNGEPIRVAACYPRAVKWLLHSAGLETDEKTIEVINMRELDAESTSQKLLQG